MAVTRVLGSSPACDITAVMYMYLHFSKLTTVFETSVDLDLRERDHCIMQGANNNLEVTVVKNLFCSHAEA